MAAGQPHSLALALVAQEPVSQAHTATFALKREPPGLRPQEPNHPVVVVLHDAFGPFLALPRAYWP